MIFITLGTQKFQLNRLLKQIDEYVEQGLIREEVIAQVGHSDYKPKNYKFDTFFDKEDFDDHIKNSRIVVTHSGVGSIVNALNYKKPIIVYPRLKKYKEHVDNHQLDIATAFAKKGYLLCCSEKEQLIDLIEKCNTEEFTEYVSQTSQIINMIDSFLNQDVQIATYRTKGIERDMN